MSPFRTRLLFPAALLALLALSPAAGADEAGGAKLLEVRKIWDKAPHNAFTDLFRHDGKWYCAFREGTGHVSPDGVLRVIRSADGVSWEPVARLTYPDADVREAKISLTPDGRLLLNGAIAPHDKTKPHRSVVWLSKDGTDWGEAKVVVDPAVWLWRVTWHEGTGYGIGYKTGAAPRGVHLYTTTNGVDYTTLVKDLHAGGYPNEHGMLFLPDESAVCLLRRDEPKPKSQIGTAKPPYTEWTWKDLPVQIGGPELVQLPDGRIVAIVRLVDKKTRTSLCWVDVQNGKLTEFLTLPSAGDTSYAGAVWHEGVLWISYYSSHESPGKNPLHAANVYLAKVEFKPEVKAESGK